MKKKIYIGSLLACAPVGGYGGFNTSIHRLQALSEIGFDVTTIDSYCRRDGAGRFAYRAANKLFQYGFPVCVPDLGGINGKLVEYVSSQHWDYIWLDKAMVLSLECFKTIKSISPCTKIIGFSPDDMYGRHNQTKQFLDTLPEYDLFLTTKTFNVDELLSLGCPNVKLIENGYDPSAFSPISLTSRDRADYGSDLGFIGSYEEDRALAMLFLAENGLTVRVWGNGWGNMTNRHPNIFVEGVPVRGRDYAKVCCSTKINLCFLRKLNRDKQTTRSVEIPACGGFMLAERTKEHNSMFTEGEEAEFFDSREELLAKCRSYLRNDSRRKAIALAGYRRCLRDGYSNAERLRSSLKGFCG